MVRSIRYWSRTSYHFACNALAQGSLRVQHATLAGRAGNWLMAAAVVASAFFVAPARADGGEVTFSALVDQEVAWARYSADGLTDKEKQPLLLYVPRFGGAVDYGVSNRLHLGLAGRASLPSTTELRVENHGNLRNVLLRLSTRDVLVTGRIQATVYDGTTLFADLLVDVGMQWRRWQVISAGHVGAPPPQNPETATWHAAPYVRIATPIRYRPWQHFAVAVSPYVGISIGKERAVGATLTLQVPVAAGPSL